jgi:hypothetical protein
MQIRRNRIRHRAACKMMGVMPIRGIDKLSFRTRGVQAEHIGGGLNIAARRPSIGGRTRLYSGVFSER